MILKTPNEALKVQTCTWLNKAVAALAAFVVICVTVLTLSVADQPPLDLFSFRQAQTALTSYWFQREGYDLAYQTPVAGYPWAIPFEFPFYQVIVSLLSHAFGISIVTTGRLVSYSALLISVPVVWSINRRLSLPPLVFFCFVALTFTTPVYLYWGRAVLIETTALFFVLLAIKFFLDYLLAGRGLGNFLLFSVFMTICMLQKVTTGFPVLVILAFLLCVVEVKEIWSTKRIGIAKCGMQFLLLLLPLIIGFIWTHYADAVKERNPLGQSLTSSALSHWNWGSLEQRLSSALWFNVIYMRVLVQNLGGLVGASIIALSLWLDVSLRIKTLIVSTVLMGLLPIFMFTNLHIIHDYYQAANLIFLVYAVAIALGAVMAPRAGGLYALALLVCLLVINCSAFVQTGYFSAMTELFGKNNRDVAIGEILKRELPVDGQFVAFGNDWSSTFAYQAERKSFTVPPWFEDYDNVINHPAEYVEKGHLGAVIACSDKPNLHQVFDLAKVQGEWKVGEAAGCVVAVPALPIPSGADPGDCQGSIDRAQITKRDGLRVITFAGWSATTTTPATAADQTFLVFTQKGKPPLYVDTLRVPRLDVNSALGLGEEADFGFSRLLSADVISGQYEVAVAHNRNGHLIVCPIKQLLVLN